MGDVHLLVASLHRQAMVLLSDRSGYHFQGLGAAGAHMKLSSSWKRKLRTWDALLGIAEKITEASVVKYMKELRCEVDKASVQHNGTATTNLNGEGKEKVEGEFVAASASVPSLASCGAALPVAAAAVVDDVVDQEYQNQEQKFKVEVSKTDSDPKLGLDTFCCTSPFGGPAIRVEAIIAGLIRQWNRDHPGMQVLVGDYICEVNGEQSSTEKMLAAIVGCTDVQLLIKRGRPPPPKVFEAVESDRCLESLAAEAEPWLVGQPPARNAEKWESKGKAKGKSA